MPGSVCARCNRLVLSLTFLLTGWLMGQSVPAGGAPHTGSGNLDFQGFVRVIEGDTVEIHLAGSQVGIGLIGIEVPMGNTVCGKQASGALQSLVRGGFFAEEDLATTFDSRGRRMYYGFARDRQPLGLTLVQNGFARASGQGKETATLRAAEAQARAEKRGCLWDSVTSGTAVESLNAPLGQSALSVSNETSLSSISETAADPATATGDSAAAAIPSAAGFTIETVTSGLNQPTAFAWTPDGRILLAEKHGLVRMIKNGVLQAGSVIDISSRVNDYWDRGLLGIAVDPDFATNGYIYLLYVYENNTATWNDTKTSRLARYTMSGDAASLATETVILGSVVGATCEAFPVTADCIPSDSPSHTMGALKFATDKSLFVSTGDGSHFNYVDERALRVQNKDSLAGKVLRITTSGLGLPGNPFVAEAGNNLPANRSKVWAYGLRNAYRFNLRPTSGVPYLGDVGWNTWEEVNVGTIGANLGWPCYEGAAIQNGYQGYAACQSLYNAGTAKAPLVSYNHGGVSSAVTGGAFYTGSLYPAEYQGAFFYGDYALNTLSYLKVDANHNLIGSPVSFAPNASGPVDIEMGPDGNLYYLAIVTGELCKIRYTAGNGAPTAVASASVPSGPPPLTVAFSSAGSSDPEGETLSYLWNFGDGTATTTEANPTHVYQANGTYTARLTVWDPSGNTATKTLTITVKPNQAPVARISAPASTLTYKVGDLIQFSGSATDLEDGTLPVAALSWAVVTYHCPGGVCHTHPFSSATGVSAGSFRADDHGDDSYFVINLKATDAQGLTATTSVAIRPLLVDVSLTTSPAGLNVTYNGTIVTAPYTRKIIVGGTRTVGIVTPQGANTFSYWSDNGAASHNVQIGSAGATFTAYFGPPIVSSVASRVTGNRVTLTWNTHEFSDSQIEYGTTPYLGSFTAVNSSQVTTHSMDLQNLLRRVTYYYRVISKDKLGATGVSAIQQFVSR
jgi:glucose/arabinose dehydrogenase/endonuclease YncB( thermonuclease family)